MKVLRTIFSIFAMEWFCTVGFSEDKPSKPIEVYNIGREAVIYLHLKDVQKELFDFTESRSGHAVILLVDENLKPLKTEEDISLANHIIEHLPKEEKGEKKYMVGPMSAHGSERFMIKSEEEVLYITPYWENHWKKYNGMRGPAVDIQRCERIGEKTIKGVKYEIYEANGLYFTIKLPLLLTDAVDWFKYEVPKR